MPAFGQPNSPQDRQHHMANIKGQMTLEGHQTSAEELGINGTPGFIIGTELVTGALYLNNLKSLIRQIGRRRVGNCIFEKVPRRRLIKTVEAMRELCTMLIEKDPFTGHSFTMNILNTIND